MGRGRRLAAVAGAAAVLLASPPARAHPHVFVDYTVDVLFGAAGPEGIRFTWIFDDLFSTMILQTFDADKNGTIAGPEVGAIEQKHFGNLKEYGYFVSLKVDGKPMPVSAVRDFHVKVARGQVTYVFTVPLAGASATHGSFEAASADPTIYSWFALLPPRPFQVSAPRRYKVECTVVKDAKGVEVETVACRYNRAGR